MRRLISIVGLQLYALCLAVMQLSVGLRTDEAKYLLNVPYPHPPLARSVLATIKMFPYQELLWRIVLASLLVQLVWCVIVLTSDKRLQRLLACLWLTVPALILQSGSIMMAPLTAVSGFLFLIAAASSQRIKLEKDEYLGKRQAFFLGVLWLASLFTAYQAVLYLPLVIAAFLRSSIARWKAVVYIFAPLVALGLYTLINPLAIASMGNAATENGSLSLLMHAHNAFMLWVLGGGIVFGITGIIGIVLSRRFEIIATLVLIFTYCTLSYHDYYAIFLVPLLLYGTFVLVRTWSRSSIILLTIIGTLSSLCVSAYFLQFFDTTHANLPRQTMTQLHAARPDIFDATASQRTMLMVGYFGHDWQYESPFEVHKYSDALKNTHSDILVCLQSCTDTLKQGMQRVAEVTAAEVYVQ
ncbi:MAG: hypothetical protein KBD00_03190 [Candidatus Peribacteraceae bacterium]|nr:hypothetical protein [Candidatus Peribacteraceae bacterium]